MRAFVPPARAGEWAVTGAFRFAHRDPATIQQRELRAFRHGWFGLETFGGGTLVEVGELAEAVHDELGRRLAAYLMTQYGINPGAAIEAALEELTFASSLCNHPLKTVLALDRELNEQGLIETTRIVA
jgi:Family of unknown function (DUF6505)